MPFLNITLLNITLLNIFLVTAYIIEWKIAYFLRTSIIFRLQKNDVKKIYQKKITTKNSDSRGGGEIALPLLLCPNRIVGQKKSC